MCPYASFPARPSCQLFYKEWAEIYADPEGDTFAVLEGGPSGLAINGALAVGDADSKTLKFKPAFGSANAQFSIKALDSKAAESPVTQISLTFGGLIKKGGDFACKQASSFF